MILSLLLLISLAPTSILSEGSTPFTFSDERLELALNDPTALHELYTEYVATHGHTRPYCQKRERLEFFVREIEEVLELRRDPYVRWQAGINFMADMSSEERSLMRGHTNRSTTDDNNSVENKLQFKIFDAPDEFDGWREKGLVGPLRDQRKSSCWAHSTVAILESQRAYLTGVFEELSVEELWACVYKHERRVFKGGDVTEALEYLDGAGRLGFEKDNKEKNIFDLDYIVLERRCNKAWKTPNALEDFSLGLYGEVGHENALFEKLVCTGPVGVAIDTEHTKFEKYKHGIFTPSGCKKQDHAVTVVGYTREAIIIRNSWGSKWGVGGYMYFDRNGPECFMYDFAVHVRLEQKGNKYADKECRMSETF